MRVDHSDDYLNEALQYTRQYPQTAGVYIFPTRPFLTEALAVLAEVKLYPILSIPMGTCNVGQAKEFDSSL